MTEAYIRLRAWVRDYGHTVQEPFLEDLTAILDENDELREWLKDANAAAERIKNRAIECLPSDYDGNPDFW
jgi:hypothetical protein